MSLKPLLARLRSDILVRRLGQDGGPGSGNWGHKGRPGLVGGSAAGSGAGGGKQYRGGRADIGFFNSRKDWLNGLSGESQHEATKLLNSAKKNIPSTSEMTPEAYIMKNMPLDARWRLVDLAGEARSWEDRGVHLQMENLNNDESYGMFALGVHLDKKFAGEGEDLFTEKEIFHSNYDKMLGLMTDEEKEFYLDMKAKACGLPTSGKELTDYSKPFQKEIGVLEDAELPKTDEENRKWSEFLTREEREQISKELIDVFGPDADLKQMSNMNAVEKLIIDKMKDKAEDGDAGEIISAVAKYLKNKDELVNGEFFKKMMNMPPWYHGDDEGIGRLTKSESVSMRDLLNEYVGKGSQDVMGENGQEIEDRLLADKNVPDKTKGAYLLLKAVALGLSPEGMSTFGNRRIIEGAVGSMYHDRRVKERADKKAKALAEYYAKKKDNIVVVAGDSFSEKINSMRNESGSYTHEELKKIGKQVSSELEKELEKRKKQRDKIQEKIDKIDAERRKEMDAFHAAGKSAGKDWGEYHAITMKYAAITGPLYEQQRELLKSPVIDMLKRVRKVGPSDPKAMKSHLTGRSPSAKFVSASYSNYPREWVDMSLARGNITIKTTQRGYYSDGWGISELAISGFGDDSKAETATHELGHRFEYTVPGIVEAEREFFESRTRGEEFVQLRKLCPGGHYSSDERAKKDNFINPYIGRDNGGNSFEVVSMGFEYAIHHPRQLLKDPEYANMILGLLAVG